MPVDDFSQGVVFYLNQKMGKVVGVLTWNLFGKMDLAKQVIRQFVNTQVVNLPSPLFMTRTQVIAEGKKESEIGGVVAKFDLHKSSADE